MIDPSGVDGGGGTVREPMDGDSRYPAQRFDRGGVGVYVLAVPIKDVPVHLPVPDPNDPFPGNRRVDGGHAEGFAEYWMQNHRWAAPPLLLDTRVSLRKWFNAGSALNGVSQGTLTVPSTSAEVFNILDGQHRILGWTIAVERIQAEHARALANADKAYSTGDVVRVRESEARLEQAEQASRRLEQEHVSVEVFERIDDTEHGQFFTDIATNAKGINKSVLAMFDQREVVNRVAMDLADTHPLLKGYVDREKDRMSARSDAFITAKNLADVIRAAAIGPESRATSRREQRMAAKDLRHVTDRFIQTLTDEVEDMERLASRMSEPAEVRSRSLIASPTVLRCLAGAFREVAVLEVERDRPEVDAEGESLFRNLLRDLEPHWRFPIDELWFGTGYFPKRESKAPSSRVQDVRGLTQVLTAWARAGVPVKYRP